MAIQQVDLVGNSGRPVVTPQATEQLSDAFRKGFITADDIMERVSERTRAKQELELITAQQGIADATNPELIQAKRNVQLAAGAQAQNVIATAPLAQKAKEWELKSAIFDAQSKPGGYDLMQIALSKAGFPVAVDANQGLTDANQAEILKRFSALAEYAQEKTQAEDRVANTKSRFEDVFETTTAGTTKKTIQRLFHNEQEVTGDQIKTWAQKNEALKKTPFSSWYSLRAGQASQPAQPAPAVAQPAPVVQAIQPGLTNAQQAQIFNPAISDAQRAQLFNAATAAQLIQPAATAAVAPAPVIQPTLAAVPAQNVVQPATAVGQTVGQTMVTGFTPAPAPPVLRAHEGEIRAGLALPRFKEANVALQDLQNRNYDPTSWASWVASYMPQILKSGDRKEYETAIEAWSQGLLRLESGAAITPKESSWYSKTFFPAVNDPPNVVQQKANLRNSVEQMVNEVAAGGGLDSINLRVIGLRNSLPEGNTPANGVPAATRFTPVSAPATGPLRITLPGKGNVEFDPATQRYRPIQ